MSAHKHLDKATAAGLLVALGIIFGDIGTSPLYVMKAIVGNSIITRELVLGGLSCVIWTLTLQTTIKYVIITLRADNKGEGGIFSLYTLIRRLGKWLVFPAMLGGCTLLADGIITPAISITSAIEGIMVWNPSIPHSYVVPIVIGILLVLFFLQQFGTHVIGRAFGPMMFVWFTMLAVLGIASITYDPTVLAAFNPYYAFNLLVKYPHGFALLGAVFLCTTGAEALYSDMGHCGRANIRVSWIFVKTSLLLNYAGQSAWLLTLEGQSLNGRNPFYGLMPDWFVIVGIIIATSATFIASQALISGSFTLISEAIQLGIWPKTRITYPSESKGQLYLPGVNWALLAGCILIVLFFNGESTKMEAAYGLAITLTMLATTLLLFRYLQMKRVSPLLLYPGVALYLFIEGAFFAANLHKFSEGGWVSLAVAGALFAIMYIWHLAKDIKHKYQRLVPLEDYLPQFKALSGDVDIPKYATHLVYLTSARKAGELDDKIVYSIFRKQPKRADIYWFVHVEVLDEPYTMEYKVDVIEPDDVVRIDFRLGFRVQPRINLFYRKVVEEMVKNGEVNITSRYHSLSKYNFAGDFRFVVLERFLSYDNELPFREQIVMNAYLLLKFLSLSDERSYGLDASSVTVEKAPLVIGAAKQVDLVRIFDENAPAAKAA